MAIMLIGIEFGRVIGHTFVDVEMKKAILPPVHEWTSAVSAKDGIPIGVGDTAVIQIMVYQLESMCTSPPVERPGSTLALCLYEIQVGIAFTHLGNGITTFPLESDAVEQFLQLFSVEIRISALGTVVENHLKHVIHTVRVHSAKPYFYPRMVLPHV